MTSTDRTSFASVEYSCIGQQDQIETAALGYLNGDIDNRNLPIVLAMRERFNLSTSDAVRALSRARKLRGCGHG